MSDNPNDKLVGPSEDGTGNDLLNLMSSKDGRQRLQALIAEWLRMENLVVLTGAGTSVTSGGKTMANLEHDVLATVKAMQGLPASIGAIIENRDGPQGEASSKIGFEAWLSYLVSACSIGSDPAAPFSGVHWRGTLSPQQTELLWFVEKIEKAIFAECALVLSDTGPSASSAAAIAPHLAFLAKLVARDSNLGRAHLFTLNYDTLFEQALELLGIQYFDGFTGRADARFDPSVYGLDIYYPGEVTEGRVRRFDKFLHLYKLHGSIHWQFRSGEVRARHSDLRDFITYQTLNPGQKAIALNEIVSDFRATAILPTANKYAQTLTMPYAHLFRAFQIRLAAPQTFLLIIGYGFGDDHITHIIETALMNPSLVMLIIEPNPHSASVERVRRYKDLGKRAFILTPTEAEFDLMQFRRASFDDFARSIMPDVQWLDDFLRLRRFEKQIQASGRGVGHENPATA